MLCRQDWADKSLKLGKQFVLSNEVGKVDDKILREAENWFDRMCNAAQSGTQLGQKSQSVSVCVTWLGLSSMFASCVFDI